MIRFIYLVPLLAIASTLSAPSLAQQPPPPESPLAAGARQYFTDVRLVTQNGDSVRLYSDLLKDKVVVINAFFGSCTGSCPKMAGVLAGLQERLGDHLGKDVFLLSFSVDPETDTPEKLKTYAENFRARPGWQIGRAHV